MVMRNTDQKRAAAVGASIALLQERFRKLEKMKERREEESQLMFYPQPKRSMIIDTNSIINADSNILIRDELFLPSRPVLQDPISLALNLNNSNKHVVEDYRAHHHHHQTKKTINGQPAAASFCTSLWSAHDKRGVKRPLKFDVSDVDTSLHL